MNAPDAARTIRVLHVVHAFQTGGAERVVLDLTRAGSAAIANQVCSLCPPNDLATKLDAQTTPFTCLEKRSGNDPRVVRALARLIDASAIDVVHAQTWGTYLEALIAAKWYARRRPAFVFAFHGKSMADITRDVPWRRRISQRIAHRFTDACVAPANHMAEDYARTIGISRNDVQVIHNGVDISRFGSADPSAARAALGLDAADFVIGFVGRLDGVKDIPGLVRILAQVRAGAGAKSQRIRLLVVGDGDGRSVAERVAVDMGVSADAVFAGLRDDVPLCLAAMDVYLQPSFYEGHSIAILEAMASGLPVVSTRVGGTPEIVVHGETGYLHAPADYAGLAGAVLDLYRRPAARAAMGRAGRERVIQRFSVATMVERYEDLYRRLLRNEPLRCAG